MIRPVTTSKEREAMNMKDSGGHMGGFGGQKGKEEWNNCLVILK